MLIDDVVHFCDEMFVSYNGKCGCEIGHCNYPSGLCSGSCYNCLYHIHYPDRAPENSKKEYDCVKMLYHYVCQYSYLYTTELLCAFEFEWDFIKDFLQYHILSLGCGGCADLMAFENLLQIKGRLNPISYIGIDINPLWTPIHSRIQTYCDAENIGYKTYYSDVFDFFKQHSVPDTNIVVISYLISYLYNTKQIGAINTLAELLAKQVVMHKGMPLLLIINDVNSYKRGRNYFYLFEQAIQRSGLSINKSLYKYFDTGSLYDGQKLGTPYDIVSVPFSIPREIQLRYHANKSINSTVQFLVEVS